MVHRGFSRGCQRCRDAHTKCDLLRPVCTRCKTRGDQCSGYRDINGLLFKDRTTSIIKQYSKPKKKTASATPIRHLNTFTSKKKSINDTPYIHADSSFVASGHVTVSLQDDPVSVCLQVWLRKYTADVQYHPMTSRGHFDHLYQMLALTGPSSALMRTARAVAVSSWTRSCRADKQWRWKTLIEATKSVRLAISDTEECKTNETLMAVSLLQFGDRLEECRDWGNKSACPTNLFGALALMKLREPSSLVDEGSRSLVSALRSSFFRQKLYNSTTPSSWDAFFEQSCHVTETFSPAQDLDMIFGRILRLYSDLRSTTVVCVDMGDKVSSLVQLQHYETAYSLTAALISWSKRLPTQWHPKSICLQHKSSDGAGFTLREQYTSVRIAFVYNEWRCLVLMLLTIGNVTVGDMFSHANITFDSVCESIMAAVPFFLSQQATDNFCEGNDDWTLGKWYLYEILRWTLHVTDQESKKTEIINLYRGRTIAALRKQFTSLLQCSHQPSSIR
nr:hypothetical protein CFP56_16461 [Quercus suber]